MLTAGPASYTLLFRSKRGKKFREYRSRTAPAAPLSSMKTAVYMKETGVKGGDGKRRKLTIV
jgi:hypothetical protein